MKRVIIYLIKLYKKTPISSHSMCKYYPTCSTYAIDALEEYGSIRGSIMTIKRILRCNPLSKGGYDPVKKKEKRK